MFPYRKLEIWRRSRAAVIETYRITRLFPPHERFGIVAQLRRAAVSVLTNIVEGSKRMTKRDFAHFINIGEGSAAEAAILLDLGAELEYGPQERIAEVIREFEGLERQMCAFRKKLLE